MHDPLVITFRNLDPSPALQASISGAFARLRRRCDQLFFGRVLVEAARPRSYGVRSPVQVHLDLQLAGKDAVICRQPHRLTSQIRGLDPYRCVRDAFRTAERQILALRRRRSVATARQRAMGRRHVASWLGATE